MKNIIFILSCSGLLLCGFALSSQLVVGATMQDATVNLTLQEAVESALENNLSIRLKEEDAEIAAGGIEIVEGRFDEQIKAEVGAESVELTPLTLGGATEEDKGRFEASIAKRFTTGTEVELSWKNQRYDTDADEMLLNPSYGSSVGVEVTQPLLRGFGTEVQTSELRAAEKGLEAATYQVDSQAANLTAEVKKGYWDLVFAWQDIGVRKLSLKLAEKLLVDTEVKIFAGKLAGVEVYQPQSEVTRREEDLIGAERAIGFAEDNIKLLMNSDDWFVALSPTDSPTRDVVIPVAEEVLKNALLKRPDLQAARSNVEATRIRERLAEDDLKPMLNLVGGLGYGGTEDSYGDALSGVTDDGDTRWQVGLELSFPLDNSFAKGSLRQAKAQHVKAQTSAELLRLRIKKSVRTTVRDIKLALKAMEATRKTSIATKKRLEAEQTKFDAGRSTTLDVLAAQEAYARALSQENRTNITYAKLLAELDRIQGLITFGVGR